MPRETLAERVRTPKFAAAVDRARAKLDAEDAGWVVMEPKRAKALLAVARAAERDLRRLADELLVTPEELNAAEDTTGTLARAIARLHRVSQRGEP